jgi:hypothetical protein
MPFAALPSPLGNVSVPMSSRLITRAVDIAHAN